MGASIFFDLFKNANRMPNLI